MSLDSRMRQVQEAGQFDSDVVAAFSNWIRNAPERELFRTNPWRYVEATGLPDRTALDLFLHATHLGVLDFSWGILCPMCGSFITTETGLRSLGNSFCHFCRIDVSPEVDDRVEVAFTVSPIVRRIRLHNIETPTFEELSTLAFSTSVKRPPQFIEVVESLMRWMGTVGTDASELVEIDLQEHGFYTLNAPLDHTACHIEADPASEVHELTLEFLRGRIVPQQATVGTGPLKLTIRNRTANSAQLALYYDVRQPHLPDPQPMELIQSRFLTGKELVTSQTFRDLFRAQSIPSDGGLEFRNLTLLFTDLKDSTAMYGRIGDLAAYDQVRRHFDVVLAAVADHRGAVVKTIGDAVMASFPHPVGALESAHAMHAGMLDIGGELQLKIGMHSGPCIGVELNERLDYFGQTVNLAARVQGVAHARETVITDSVLGAPGARELIETQGTMPTEDRVPLKGVEGETRIWRLT